MRFFFPSLLAVGCLLLGACSAFQDENRIFFSSSHESPRELHFNKPMPGFIRSPYAPESGWVDVRGIEPGTSVLCPYTGRVFVVPYIAGVPRQFPPKTATAGGGRDAGRDRSPSDSQTVCFRGGRAVENKRFPDN